MMHDNVQTMTSLEIAELTGKQHKNLMQAIRKMEPAWEKVQGLKFQLSSRVYNLPNGGTKVVPYYSLTKTECLYIATKFNDEARAKLVLRWQELERTRLLFAGQYHRFCIRNILKEWFGACATDDFIWEVCNSIVLDYDAVLDARFGAEGTPERARAEEDAYAFYSGQILLDARKEAKVTQAELAERTQTTKSYISKIENGVITPSVGVFYRIIAALGMRVEVIKPIY